MKAAQYRLGNIIEELKFGKWEQTTVSTLTEDDIGYVNMTYDADGCKEYAQTRPIPLTEEWLMKFGFENISDGNYNQWQKDTPGKPTIELIRRYSREHFEVYSYKQLGIDTLYVHQLQNLYFSLTGEELTVK
jgi:hypothetical protein